MNLLHIHYTRIWMMGLPGVGKTFLGKAIAQGLDGHYLGTGETLRAQIGVSGITRHGGRHDLLAPHSLDDRVTLMVNSFVQSTPPGQASVIDSIKAPRQISRWIGVGDKQSLILWVRADERVRLERLSQRDSDSQALAEAASTEFHHATTEFFTAIEQHGIDCYMVSNSE